MHVYVCEWYTCEFAPGMHLNSKAAQAVERSVRDPPCH